MDCRDKNGRVTDVEARKEMSGKEQDREEEGEKKQCVDDKSKKDLQREREREGERAGQIWATVTLGRWLRALSSVYITLTDQAKTSHETKAKPATRRVSAGGCGRFLSASTGSVSLWRFSGCGRHTPCV